MKIGSLVQNGESIQFEPNLHTRSNRFLKKKNSYTISRSKKNRWFLYLLADVASGFLKTKMTESPRRNIFEMNRSLLTGFTFFFPFPVRGTSVHISFTLKSKKMQSVTDIPFNRSAQALLPLQHHVAMTIERLHATQQFLIVSAIDQHLCVVFDGLCQHRQWPSVELLFFLTRQFFWGQFGFWFCQSPVE